MNLQWELFRLRYKLRLIPPLIHLASLSWFGIRFQAATRLTVGAFLYILSPQGGQVDRGPNIIQ